MSRHQCDLSVEDAALVQVCSGTLCSLQSFKSIPKNNYVLGLQQSIMDFSVRKSILNVEDIGKRELGAELILLSTPSHEYFVELYRFLQSTNSNILALYINLLNVTLNYVYVCSV